MIVRSTNEEGKTEPCVLRIVNKSSRRVKALWVGFDAKEQCYMEIDPGHGRPQETYNTHVWRLRFADTDALVGEYVGPSAQLEVGPEGSLRVRDWSPRAPPPKPEWGQYCKRGEALGIEIWCYGCVDPRAVHTAEHLLRRMLTACPPDVTSRLAAGGARLAVIGRHQLTTDIPEHAFLKWAEGGRDTDSTTRGLGGSRGCPTTSCGEENLLMEEDSFYPSENILIHEFGHAVMNIGLNPEDRAAIKQLYDKAYRSGLYDKRSYMMENEEEYWAEGTQAWFDATIRTDVTSGVNTREKLRARDPGLAAIMERVYGNRSWRYPQDAPAPFRMRPAPPSPDPHQQHDLKLGSMSAPGGDTAGAAAAATAAADEGAAPTTAPAAAATLSAPGVEDSMERARLAASWSGAGGGPGWLVPGVLSCCLPGPRRGRAGPGVVTVSSSSGSRGDGGGVCTAVPAAVSRNACAGGVGSWLRPGLGPGGLFAGSCAPVGLWRCVQGAVRGHTGAHATVKMS